jgi:hypothetical protein
MAQVQGWTVLIAMSDAHIEASVQNDDTKNIRYYREEFSDYGTGQGQDAKDQAIGECLTDIRDSFDQV